MTNNTVPFGTCVITLRVEMLI